MTISAKSSVERHRVRLRARGMTRVEVNIPKEDAALLRHVASALSDPSRQTEARLLLRQRFAEPAKIDLKALLASAPLEGIDIDRSCDVGRHVDL